MITRQTVYPLRALYRTPVIEELLASGADVDLYTTHPYGQTPLLGAIRNRCCLGLVRALLAAGAEVNRARKSDGATPLFVAAQVGFSEAVEALLDHGADVNQRTNMSTNGAPYADMSPLSALVEWITDCSATNNTDLVVEYMKVARHFLAAGADARPLLQVREQTRRKNDATTKQRYN
eukprot:1192772-Prorocentrum_minimum.AAC.2